MRRVPIKLMTFHLTESESDQYKADGFLVRQGYFSAEEIEALRAAVECAAANALSLCPAGKTYWLDGKRFVDIEHITVQFEHQQASNTIRVIEPVHELDSRLGDLISDSRIVDPMCDIIGTDAISIWTNKLNLKRPREGSGFGWHQDSPYWIHDSPHVDLLPNVMVALDDASETNGCFKVIRGSHTRGCLPGTSDGTQLGGFFTDPASFDSRDAVPVEVAAGALIFFNPHSVHGSSANESDSARRALILTYQPAGFPTLKSKRVQDVVSQRGL